MVEKKETPYEYGHGILQVTTAMEQSVVAGVKLANKVCEGHFPEKTDQEECKKGVENARTKR